MRLKLVDVKARVRRGAETLIAAVHNGLAGFGLLVALFLLLGGPGDWPKDAGAASALDVPVVRTSRDTATSTAAATSAAEPRQRALAAYLSRKYRVSGEATAELVGEAFRAAQRTGLDPLLILAVVAIESSFNPIAESTYGAKGLMQVVPRFHLDKLAYHGGEESVLDPRTNIRVGAEILSDYIRRAGDLQGGLQMYAGAVEDPANQYSQKVLAEKQRLRERAAAALPSERARRPGSDA